MQTTSTTTSAAATIRADLAVLERGWAETRARAQALLLAGNVLEGDRVISKAGTLVVPDRLRLRGYVAPFVGRGGEKLEGFLKDLPHFEVESKKVLDVGSSTGGFTDCLLKRGAEYVVCVDVGTNQLHWKLRSHPQVMCFEQTDIRKVTPEIIGAPFQLIVADLSFISLTKVLGCFGKLMSPSADVIVLVKPQFEVGPENIERGGIVRDEALHTEVVKSISRFGQNLGWHVERSEASCLKGADGNQEYFIWFRS